MSVYVTDRGRLCNNILQYAHVYAWGLEHGIRPVSMRFSYKYRYFDLCKRPAHNFLNYLYAKYSAKAGLIPVVRFDDPEEPESSRMEKDRKILTARNVLVTGWQVRHYDDFLKHIGEIRRLFAFRRKIVRKVSRYIGSTARKGALRLGVHIRRGDYARWQDGKFLYSDLQYIGVIRSFIKYAGAPVDIYICGNDPGLDREFYRSQLEDLDVTVNFPEGNPGEDLCLLSQCDRLIGAPSTFTLVAAMYRDIPLYWVKDPLLPVTEDSFGRFSVLFRQII